MARVATQCNEAFEGPAVWLPPLLLRAARLFIVYMSGVSVVISRTARIVATCALAGLVGLVVVGSPHMPSRLTEAEDTTWIVPVAAAGADVEAAEGVVPLDTTW